MFNPSTDGVKNDFIGETERGLSDMGLQNRLLNLKIKLNLNTGNIFYAPDFAPLLLKFDLIFIRHGETFGNCGQSTAFGKVDDELVRLGIKEYYKRIYQGNVDTDINQLTELGKQQAGTAAHQLKNEFLAQGWHPDIIFTSPLSRAQDTALSFVKANGLENRYKIHVGIREMSFGAWDNRRVCDLESTNPCHLFYLQQHALIKQSGINGNSQFQEAECFCEVLLRAHSVLNDMNQHYAGKEIVMFSHSMFGAACQILLGQGKKNRTNCCLSFDGKDPDGIAYTVPNAEPIVFGKCVRKM